ncbi:xyloside xylosyltransferase 1-like [Diadema antillarum]|uniref:xyloside xylosyltransferase 1-like n=1 Tax=Diadema antillarum TaxID=105358 RepID=UPI003A837647
MRRVKAASGEEKAPASEKSNQGQGVGTVAVEEEKNMHYASASKARERDRVRAGPWSRGRRGVFGPCLSSKVSKLLVVVALAFALYCFLKSRGYLDQMNSEHKSSGISDVHKDWRNSGNSQINQDDVKKNGFEANLPNKDAVPVAAEVKGEIPSEDADDEPWNSEADDVNRPDDKNTDNGEPARSQDIFKYHILHTLTNTHKMPHLKTRFEVCMKSILKTSSVDLLFFFVVDQQSKSYLESALQEITNLNIAKSKFQFIFMDIDDLAKELAPLVEMMQSKIQGKHPYYMESIFFLSTMLHENLLPDYVNRIIMLDTDLKFMSDIKELFDHFDRFQGDNIIGIAHEQQPVYRHIFSLYRSQNRGTLVGAPPPDGLTGFNSGVLLLNLDKMRASKHLKQFLTPDVIVSVRDKYHFRGHLGDQDFYTLVSMEKEDLFYVLPCSWNKQLCQWWKNKGYDDVWDQYFECKGKIHIYHGNCNTPIPY